MLKELLNERIGLFEEIDAHLMEIGSCVKRIEEITKQIGKELYCSKATVPQNMTQERLYARLHDAFNAALAGKLGDPQQALVLVRGPLGEIMDTSFLTQQEAAIQKPLKEVA